ncbi:GrpB family protein [Salibacterium halotolerans]|uniref:GrpB domain, predicted nucleotidyltransferase, UPF0157 family n=1 Tax=Salibacterium halotolerans TaxID=1884432 RepID=A0A1I5Y3H1_9BACI|nr:GrpB family protein [Salibacterium halotolerans]SFQ38739.1 GrpB domain, predicted nucleotidyltransferase, UPF0157 family [Salibacterium halotolerans]
MSQGQYYLNAACKSDEDLQKVTVGERTPHHAPIILHEYNPRWPALFEREAGRIRSVLGDTALQIEHIGSTSVPGLCAKPIIDIVLVVDDAVDEMTYAPDLEQAGYTLRIREPEWFEHRMFKGPDTDVHVHVFNKGVSEVERMLTFRDWLRVDTSDRELYACVKRQLAQRKWRHVQHYADAKDSVVQEIMERAEDFGENF